MLDFAIIGDVPARGIHLSFALLLCFLIFPLSRRRRAPRPAHPRTSPAHCSAGSPQFTCSSDGTAWSPARACSYVWNGIPVEAILGGLGIVLLLEATRRSIGIPLVIVCSIFLVYSIFGQSMPDIVSHKGLSLNRLIGYQWLTGEAGLRHPDQRLRELRVPVRPVRRTARQRREPGQYFLSLSFALVGRFSGGPAKAAILASGMTGMISGSSIANVVTTGTFTIPGHAAHRNARGQGGRDRGRGIDQRPDHAADHGRGRVHHRRVRRHLLRGRGRGGGDSGRAELHRAVLHLPPGGAEAGPLRTAPGGDPCRSAGPSSAACTTSFPSSSWSTC